MRSPVRAIPAARDVWVITESFGRHRLVRPSAQEMLKKMKTGVPFHVFMDRVGLLNRTDIVTARKNLEIADYSLQYSRGQLLPQLDLLFVSEEEIRPRMANAPTKKIAMAIITSSSENARRPAWKKSSRNC